MLYDVRKGGFVKECYDKEASEQYNGLREYKEETSGWYLRIRIHLHTSTTECRRLDDHLIRLASTQQCCVLISKMWLLMLR